MPFSFARVSLILLACCFLGVSPGFAQAKLWTLQECLEYATENNLQVQQSVLQAQIAKNDRQTAQWDYAPDLNLSSGYNWNFGLNIDPVTNQISQQTRQTANLNLSSQLTLFNGGRNWNSVSAANAGYLAAMYEADAAKNDIQLNVATAYLQVLLNREIVEVAKEQLIISNNQVRRMEKLVNSGSNPKGDLLQLEAQQAQDNQSKIDAENQLKLSLVRLANLLQLENPNDFDIADPDLTLPEPSLLARDPEAILATALEKQPVIKGAEKRLEQSAEQTQIAYAPFLPTLNVVGSIGTSYSNQIFEPTSFITTPPEQIGVVADGSQTPVLSQPRLRGTDFEQVALGNQLDNNLNEFIGLSLTVPIFNKLATRNNYQNAQIRQKQQKLALDQEKNNLRQTIYQAHADAKASYNNYLAAKKSVDFNEESFKYAQKRFKVGAINQFDFQNAKNNLTIARSQMIRSKYDYIFKVKVLEFYLNNSIQL